MILDAGSSVRSPANTQLSQHADSTTQGTRVHIYRWLNSQRARKDASDLELNSLPQLETKKKWTLKIKPGVLLLYLSWPRTATDTWQQVSRPLATNQNSLDPTT